MGNYISCASSRAPSDNVKVMHMNGRVEEFKRRIKAAQLMLENADQFVCHSKAIEIGRRVIPLSADEELKMGNLYFLLPMHKSNSVLSGSDVASLISMANSIVERTSKMSYKILPVLGDFRPFPPKKSSNPWAEFDKRTTAQESEVPGMNLKNLSEQSLALAKYRMSRCRSWKPNLETITETRLLRCSTSNELWIYNSRSSNDIFRGPTSSVV